MPPSNGQIFLWLKCFLRFFSIWVSVLDAFEEQIRASLETTIKKKLTDGISKVDSLMQNLPKQVKVDDFVSLNVTFVNQPVLESSSIALDIDGLFSGNYNSQKFEGSSAIQKNSLDTAFCHDRSPMLGISLDEDVFSSASLSYFQVNLSLAHIYEYRFDRNVLSWGFAGWAVALDGG